MVSGAQLIRDHTENDRKDFQRGDYAGISLRRGKFIIANFNDAVFSGGRFTETKFLSCYCYDTDFSVQNLNEDDNG